MHIPIVTILVISYHKLVHWSTLAPSSHQWSLVKCNHAFHNGSGYSSVVAMVTTGYWEAPFSIPFQSSVHCAVNVDFCLCMYVCMYVCIICIICIYVSMYVSMYVCIYVYMYVCMYV